MKLGFGSSPEKNGVPRIERISPSAAIPGGEIAIYGSGFSSRGALPQVHFGEVEAGLVLASEKSFRWYEEFGRKVDELAAVDFVFDFLLRTGRVSRERLLAEHPLFMNRHGLSLYSYVC